MECFRWVLLADNRTTLQGSLTVGVKKNIFVFFASLITIDMGGEKKYHDLKSPFRFF